MTLAVQVPNLDIPSPPPSKKQKLGGYDFYRSIGSPKYVVAPMVDQSELAWRLLSRSPLPESIAGPSTTIRPEPSGPTYTRHEGGAHLCYTPMIHAKVFCTHKAGSRGTDGQFNMNDGEEGSHEVLAGIKAADRPLFVQFCANDPDVLLEAAKRVENHCDAVDINFGCPQNIARRGNYGSFLQDDWELIKSLISTLHVNLSIPVTAKFRIHPSLERTLAYAQMIEAAGAQIITVHGRTREMKGQHTGLADWEIIKKMKEIVKIPVFANGNILYGEDVEKCLELTGCDGVMSAEGNLSNPAIFLPPNHPYSQPPIPMLCNRYLDIVDSLKTQTGGSAVKSHLFRLMKPYLDSLPDEKMRERIGLARTIPEYRVIINDLEEMMKPDIDAAGPSWKSPPIDPKTGYKSLPPWVVQPYIRPLATLTSTRPSSPTPLDSSSSNPSSNPSHNLTTPQLPPGEISAEEEDESKSSLHCSHPSCNFIAASRCSEGACLTHCRSIKAVKAGMGEEEAIRMAENGMLEGKGCESHEEKVRARKERQGLKRKKIEEGRQAKKIRKMELKSENQGQRQHQRQRQQEEIVDTTSSTNGLRASKTANDGVIGHTVQMTQEGVTSSI